MPLVLQGSFRSKVYLSLDERGSEFVCLKCENKINNLRQFKRKINENHKYFEKLSSLTYNIANNENFIKTEPELILSKESTLKEFIQRTRKAKHRKNFNKLDLNVKVVLEDIFSDFKNSNEKCSLCFKEVFYQKSKIHLTDDIKDKIYSILQINFSVGGTGSEFLCSKCENEIKNFHRFKEMIYEKQKYFKMFSSMKKDKINEELTLTFNEQLVKSEPELSISSECESSFFSNGDLRKHELQFHKDDIKPHQCNICSRRFLARRRLAMHMDTHRENRTKDHHCDICKTSYFHKESLRQHILYCHEDKPFSCTSCGKSFNWKRGLKIHTCNYFKKSVRSTKKYECDFCGKMFQVQRRLAMHMDTHRENRTKDHHCVVCESSFFHMESLRNHIFQNHEVNLFSCSLCRKTFKLKRNLESHICRYVQELNDSQQFTHCQVCGKIFKYAFRLKHHQRVHLNSKHYQCDICGKEMMKRSRVVRHMNTHIEKKRRDHHCDICKTSYFDKHSLRKHILHCHEDKPFSCTSCGKSYKLEQNLKYHICNSVKKSYKSQHGLTNKQDQRSFPCDICGKIFQKGFQLREHHRKVHLKIKTNHCKICDKSFNARHFVKHMETHRENRTRDHHCHVCENSYFDKDGLRSHLKNCHENFEKPYECDFCGKKFNKRHEVASHVELHRKYRTRDFNCDICKTSYFNKGLLQNHRLYYHGKGFSCTLCGRTFKMKRSLKFHSCSYFKELNKRKYVDSKKINLQGQTISQYTPCEICGRTFKHVSRFKQHMKGHSNKNKNKKPYDCDICDKKFFCRSKIIFHMETHREIREKDYQCHICKNSYFHKRSLQHHMFRVHEEKKFPCDCGKIFKSERNLESHTCRYFKLMKTNELPY
ncbi:CLUMA_CG000738, isoform A [Clunio marinus]|uniref:CLUMA_CG000738, isoform A n=1 Tax=Clunio marinus TaxID=568069 RepID=A0A1J1HFW5_9DIPT|nr:CLUMA_CG000738, isoform A [Clunio marinus]